MATRIGTAQREIVLVEDAHVRPMMGNRVLESLPSRNIPYSIVDPFILVVGTQKIVSDLEEGLRRINEYAFPLEDARAQAAYGIRSAVNKVLIINREVVPGRIIVVFVDEVLGF